MSRPAFRLTERAALGESRRRAVHPALRRFRSHRMALVGSAALVVLAALAAAAPWIAPYQPGSIDLHHVVMPPSPAHLLGTDELGRDVLTRVLYGGRVSLPVGLCSTAIALAVGMVYGSVAGLRGGRVDALLMRVVDFLLSFPAIFVLLVLASFHPASELAVILYIGLFGWMGVARLVRGQVLSLRERDFVVAVRSQGAGAWRIVTRHLVPNASGPIIVAGTLGVGAAMLIEATLDFLGLGVSPDTPTWGNLLTNAQLYLTTEPLLAVVPGLLITITVLAVSAIGDGLRDALDPYWAAGAR